MSLNATKPVFRVSDKTRLNPASSFSETSLKIEISFVAFRYMNNKGTDQTAQMRRQV